MNVAANLSKSELLRTSRILLGSVDGGGQYLLEISGKVHESEPCWSTITTRIIKTDRNGRETQQVEIFRGRGVRDCARSTGSIEWVSMTVPITIEVTRDVPVKTLEIMPNPSYSQERGSLYSNTAFLIREGQRFQMIKMGMEGGCLIEYKGSQYELISCPWTPGFTDNQSDIFVIVEAP